jgi:preprotein translocase subunit SecF/SecD/SecF fusion protein
VPLVKYIPDTFRIRFMDLRHWAFPFSALLTLVSVAAFVFLGLNAGIDFRGGTLVEVQATQGRASIADVRTAVTGLNLGEVQVQEFGSPSDLLIRVGSSTPAAAEQIRGAIGSQYTIRRVEVVGPSVSNELVQQSIVAMVLGLLAILAYLWFRFESEFAIGAIITTLHDIVLVIGLYALFQLEFDLTSIAAILTIMGYSLNDTVVIYDRIRDMMRRYKRMPITELLDASLNATVSRTIIVAGSTFFATLALYLFGGEVLRGFSLAMLFGVVIGTYSTVFVAVPILYYLGLRASAVSAAEGAEADARASAKPTKPAA